MVINSIISHKKGGLLTTHPNATLKEVARVLTDSRIGALPVIDGSGNLCGIISERDIVKICANNDSALLTPVKDAMTSKLETASPSDKIDSALARMTDRRIRHLPVLDNGKLVAIVSIGDLVKAQIDSVIAEADAMRAYITAG